jgi:hypothetical protein
MPGIQARLLLIRNIPEPTSTSDSMKLNVSSSSNISQPKKTPDRKSVV